jgi:hypothetical protein
MVKKLRRQLQLRNNYLEQIILKKGLRNEPFFFNIFGFVMRQFVPLREDGS